MQCPKCQRKNPNGSRFCNGCGAKLEMTCSACDHINPPGSRFCNACGHHLNAAGSVPHTETQLTTDTEHCHPKPEIPEAERRQLTVMFCDLVGSTELSGRLDPEVLRDVIRAYQSTSTEVIERYDGYIAQHLGDGLMVYFGWPQAHEDDAHRAIRAGLGIVQSMDSLNDRLEHEKGVRLAVRIGIHTGPVVIGEIGSGASQEQLALGETPNVAARLQGLAEADTVVMSATVFGLVQGYFDCDDLGAQDLRGVTEPLGMYRVLRDRGAQSRLEIMSTLTPLVGREQEVGLLLERWEQAQNGQGQVVLLSGEAGIGKSRLVQTVKKHVAGEPHTLQECRCSPYYTNSAFFPLAELLQRKLGWQSTDTSEAKLHKLETVLAQTHLEVNTAVPLFTALLSLPLPDDRYPLIQLSSQQHRQQTLEALLQLVLLAAAQHPVLFIVEDLHWIDPSTLEFLALLMDQTPTTSIFMLLTCRPEFQPTWSHRSYLTEISLSPLSHVQIEQLAIQVASGKALPVEVTQQLVAKTDGVPLYVEEMTKSVLESGVVKAANGHYELTAPLSSFSIPATLQDSLMARLDRLMTAKVIAQLGATIGRQFSYELLSTVSPIDDGTLQGELNRLIKAEILYQRGLPPHATYIFKHSLIQDTAYESLLRTTRQGYHRRIAEVLAERFPKTAENQPELLAHHYSEAGLNEQGVDYWYQAGQRASQRSAYAEAIAHLKKGLEVLKTVPETPRHIQLELQLQTTLGPALMATQGQTAPELEQTYSRALELCQHLGETSQLFPVLWGLCRFHYGRGAMQTAREFGEQLLHLAQRQHDSTLLVVAHQILGITLCFLGEFTLAHMHLEKGMALAISEEQRALAVHYGVAPSVACLSFVAQSLWCLGYPDQALQKSREAHTLAQKLEHPYSLGYALYYAARLHLLRREVRIAHEQVKVLMSLATEQGFPVWEAYSTVLRGWVLVEQGQGEEGVVQIHQGMTAGLALGANTVRLIYLPLLAEAHGKLGQVDPGLHLLAEAWAARDRGGPRLYEAEFSRLKGELLLQHDDSDVSQGEACFHQALDVARSQQAKSWELRSATSLAQLWQRHGKQAEAYDLLAPVYGWFTEGLDTADLKDARTLLEELRS